MDNTREKLIEQAEDILTKWEFFYGQRAGRELWAEKPKDVQDKDIEAFNRDISVVRSAIANGVTVQKWIPVAERLPESGERVIVCRKGGEVEQGVFLGVNGWWKVYGTNTKSVTHWMSMPAPPEDC